MVKKIWLYRRWILSVNIYISVRRSSKKLLINYWHKKNTTSMSNDYAHRWAIEVLFGSLKSGEFDLEATHMTHFEKVTSLYNGRNEFQQDLKNLCKEKQLELIVLPPA